MAALNFGFDKRLPMLLQAKSGECGLACIAMVASYFGHDIDLRDLRAPRQHDHGDVDTHPSLASRFARFSPVKYSITRYGVWFASPASRSAITSSSSF